MSASSRQVLARASKESELVALARELAISEGINVHAVLSRIAQGTTGAPGAVAQQHAHQRRVLAASSHLQRLRDKDAPTAKITSAASRLLTILDESPLPADAIDDAARALLEDSNG